MEGHAQKCVERHRELAHKTVDIHHKVSTPCFDDHQVKSRRSGRGGSQIVWSCLYLVRFGGPNLLWTVNFLVRSVTKWNRACD